MGPFINQRMRKVPAQGLYCYQIRLISTRDKSGSFRSEESRQCPLKFAVQNMISGRQARCCYIQSESVRANFQSLLKFRMTRQPIIVAAGKVREHTPAKANIGAVNLLKGFRFD